MDNSETDLHDNVGWNAVYHQFVQTTANFQQAKTKHIHIQILFLSTGHVSKIHIMKIINIY